jgi:hypothetical protein
MNTKRKNYNEYMNNNNYAKLYKFLFQDEFRGLSNDAKLLYCLMDDRLSLSIKSVEEGKNYWLDKNGDVFIHFTKENIKDLMNCAGAKAIKLKKELVEYKLIEDIRIGFNKPNKIYIKNIDYSKNKVADTNNQEVLKSNLNEVLKVDLEEVSKFDSTNTYLSKTNLNETENNNNTENYVNHQDNEYIENNVITEKEDIKDLKILPDQNYTKEDLKNLQEKINKITNGNINHKRLVNLCKVKGIEKIEYYINNYDKFKSSKHNSVGYFIKAVEEEYTLPVEYITEYSTNNNQKPMQSTNFEQRVYDEEFYEGLYDNFRNPETGVYEYPNR